MVMMTLAVTAFGYAFSKTTGRVRNSLLPDFQLAPTRIRRFIHFPWDLSFRIIAFSGDGSRFCARARALARHPLQMFVYPERWGDFPQTQRPVSRPASLAYYLLVISLYFS